MAALRTELRALPKDVWVISSGLFINKFGNFVNVFVILYLTNKGYSAAAAGAALAVIGLGNFIGNALGGMLADAYGRRMTILISTFGAGIITILVPLVSSYAAIVAVLAVLGIFAQLFRPAASALVVDSVRPDQLLSAFALLRLAINVGMAAGPAVGGLLSSISYSWVFFGDGITSIIYGLLALFFLKEKRPTAKPKAVEVEAPKTTVGYGVVLRDRHYLAYLLAMVSATYVYIQSTATLPLHVIDHGFSNEQFGLLLGLNALLVVVLELPITKFTGKFSTRPVIAAGMVLLGIGMAATGVGHALIAIAVTVALWSFAEMIYTPIANAYPGEVAPPDAIGRYQGAEGLAHTLGATLGPAVGGALYAASPGANWIVCLVVAFAGAGLIFLAKPVARPATEAELELAALEDRDGGLVADERLT